jgi:hypothetical protein
MASYSLTKRNSHFLGGLLNTEEKNKKKVNKIKLTSLSREFDNRTGRLDKIAYFLDRNSVENFRHKLLLFGFQEEQRAALGFHQFPGLRHYFAKQIRQVSC